MPLTKLQRQVQDLANDIDENYVEIDQVDKDEIDIESGTDCDGETTLEDDYMSEPENVLEEEEPDPTPPPSPVKKVKKKVYQKRTYC